MTAERCVQTTFLKPPYLGIHVIEHGEESPLAGTGRDVSKKVSPLNFTVPKPVWKLQGDLESEREEAGSVCRLTGSQPEKRRELYSHRASSIRQTAPCLQVPSPPLCSESALLHTHSMHPHAGKVGPTDNLRASLKS